MTLLVRSTLAAVLALAALIAAVFIVKLVLALATLALVVAVAAALFRLVRSYARGYVAGRPRPVGGKITSFRG